MKKNTFLLPRSFRLVGIFFIVIGVVLGIARFHYGYKPEFLDFKMFAFYSYYIESKYMEVLRNNLGEELAGFFLITGLFLTAFSREKVENELNNQLRLKAFFLAFYLNFLFLLAALFFTFGFAFVYMLMVNMGVGLLAYIISFRFLVLQNRNKS